MAVKVFAPDVASDPDFKRRHASRMSSAEGVRHPNLISLLNSGEEDGMLYLVMEFVPGKSLARSTKGRVIDFDLSLSIIGGICAGVAHAHEKGLIHGSLSPHDVLLTQEASPKVGNFGMGRDAHTVADVSIPEQYTAPELADGGQPTKASDIYAIGAIFYELISGTPYRFGGPKASQLEGTPQGVDGIIARAVSKDPAKRGDDALIFYERLRQAAGSKEGAAQVPETQKEKPLAKAAEQKPDSKLEQKPEPKPEKKSEQAPAKKDKDKDGDAPAAKVDGPPLKGRAKRRAKRLARAGGKPKKEGAAKYVPDVIRQATSKSWVKLVAIVVLLLAIHQVWNYRQSLKEKSDAILAQNDRPQSPPVVIETMQQPHVIEMLPNQTKPVRPADDFAPVENDFPQDTETPMSSLERLRSALVQGSRSEMPLGTISTSDGHYFFVEQEMSWFEASAFAESHGGHLALPETDMRWRRKDPNRLHDIWVGVGRSGADGFTRLDGKAWTPSGEVSDSGPFIYQEAGGKYRSASGSMTKAFVIQWGTEGSKPPGLQDQLTATAASLKGSSPVFPPMTVAAGARHYLAVARSCTWEEARVLAESAGGQLAALSDEGELAELRKATAHHATVAEFWTGGHLAGESWAWTTGEPWRAVAWANESNAALDEAAMFLNPASGVDAKRKSDTAAGFIIEWSQDAESNQAPAATATVEGGAIEALSKRAKELIAKAGQDKESAHKKNTDKLAWDLDAHIRGLKKSEQDAIRPAIADLKKCVQNNRLTKESVEASGVSLTPFMAKLCNYIIDKQGRIDADHVTSLQGIHRSYLNRLGMLRDQAKEAGQIKAQIKATELIEGSQNFEAWVASMGG